MSTLISNAAPRAIIQGFKDSSGAAPVYDPVPVPTHLPLFPLFTQKGRPGIPQLVAGDSIVDTYGAETFSTRGKFYNHQTLFADFARQGQSIMIERILPPDAGPAARLLLSLDIVEDLIPQYERNVDGTFKIDQSGQKIPTGETEAGHVARWVINDWATGPGTNAGFGQMVSKVGGLTSSSDEQSTQFPILELRVSSQGEWGNRCGLRLSAPNQRSYGGADTDLMETLKSYLYRFQFVQRASATSSPNVVPTLLGDQALDLSLVPGMYDAKAGGLPVSANEVLVQSYTEQSTGDRPRRIGPFDALHVYDTNLKAVLAMIAAAEAPLGMLPELTMDADSEYLNLVNPFTATHLDGAPYATLQLKGPADGGVYLTDSTTLYAAGGSDGTVNEEAFDAAVKAWADGWDQNSIRQDEAAFPFNFIWDSGFSLETKESLQRLMSVRPDIAVVNCTQDVMEPQNSMAEDSSIAISLRASGAAYPESVLHGTPVARFGVFGQSGYLLDHGYKKLVPLSLEFLVKVRDMCGAGTGVWDMNRAFDTNPNNLITLFRHDSVNNIFRPAAAAERDWANGLVWAQSFDTKSLFFPAIQTGYDDDTSVLNSFMTLLVALEGIKASYRSWRLVTGRSGLTKDQVREELTAILTADLAESRFGNRYVIEPEVKFTGKDEQRGYSYTVIIHIYAPNMISVGQYTIELHRRSDEQGA